MDEASCAMVRLKAENEVYCCFPSPRQMAIVCVRDKTEWGNSL